MNQYKIIITPENLEAIVETRKDMRFTDSKMNQAKLHYTGDAVGIANAIFFDKQIAEQTYPDYSSLRKTDWNFHRKNLGSVYENTTDLTLDVGDEIDTAFFNALTNEYPVLSHSTHEEIEEYVIDTQWENTESKKVSEAVKKQLQKDVETSNDPQFTVDFIEDFCTNYINDLDWDEFIDNLKEKLSVLDVEKEIDIEAIENETVVIDDYAEFETKALADFVVEAYRDKEKIAEELALKNHPTLF